jgi:hypothetical protein
LFTKILNKSFALVVAGCILSAGIFGLPATANITTARAADAPETPNIVIRIYLPITLNSALQAPPPPPPAPVERLFAAESAIPWNIQDPVLRNRAKELGLNTVRKGMVSWHDMQPVEGGPIDWSKAAELEGDLRTLAANGLKVDLLVFAVPDWAQKPNARADGKSTFCSAIAANKLPAFAEFMRQIVERYSTPEFNVKIWEMFNEEDIDPNTPSPDSLYGCWGDAYDPYFGGRLYGQMLNTIAPVVRAADPNAQIWVGGLVLNAPVPAGVNDGQPQKFMEGILVAGAGGSFDGVAFHAYGI